MLAFCYASGHIGFGDMLPAGAIPLAKGEETALKELIAANARHGYDTEVKDGRLTKIPGTDCLLVPGVPEERDQIKALEAVRAFVGRLSRDLPVGVETLGSSAKAARGLGR